ncbi:MAG: RMD1 family protein [Alphaproteobacteria bacterium]|nr:RMD1 family protein [Alphaproteobacteria bacterium]
MRARAVILGERLDHRGLGPGGTALADPVPITMPSPISAFAFRWGAVVIFGADPAAEAALLQSLAPRITNPTDSPAEEVTQLTIGAERDGVDAEGVIQLCDTAPERLAVVADALAKSAALTQQEARIAGTLDRLELAVANLRAAGRLSFSSRALHRQIGHALSAHSRNLARVEAADKPEVLWDHPKWNGSMRGLRMNMNSAKGARPWNASSAGLAIPSRRCFPCCKPAARLGWKQRWWCWSGLRSPSRCLNT